MAEMVKKATRESYGAALAELGEKYKNKVEHIGVKPGFDVTDTLIF